MSQDPKLTYSRHSGPLTKHGVTVEISIYRLDHTGWTLEVVDGEGTSTVWDNEFATDDEALAEFHRSTADSMLEYQVSASKFTM